MKNRKRYNKEGLKVLVMDKEQEGAELKKKNKTQGKGGKDVKECVTRRTTSQRPTLSPLWLVMSN